MLSVSVLSPQQLNLTFIPNFKRPRFIGLIFYVRLNLILSHCTNCHTKTGRSYHYIRSNHKPLLLILAAAWVLGFLFSSVGLPEILGQMLAGIILGPPLLDIVTPSPCAGNVRGVGHLFRDVPYRHGAGPQRTPGT